MIEMPDGKRFAPPQVIILHDPYIAPQCAQGDEVNQGSRAYAAGLRNLVRERLGAETEIRGIQHEIASFYLEELRRGGDNPGATIKHLARNANSIVRTTKAFDTLPLIGSVCRLLSRIGDERINSGRGDLLSRMLRRLFSRRWDRLRCFDLISNAKLVISSGNGLFTDQFAGNMWTMLFDLYIAQELGKTTIAVNQTIDVHDPFLKRLVKAVFDRTDYIAVREPLSVEHLEAIGIDRNRIALAADCACINEAIDDSRVETILREENIPEGAIGLVVRGDRSDNYDDWARAVREIKKRFNRDVVFLTSCHGQDKHLAEEVNSRETLIRPSRPFTFAELIGIYKRLSLLISDRYHANVFGLMAETPIVPLTGNSSKIHGLLQFYDYPIEVSDVLDASNIEAMLANVKHILDNPDQARRAIKGGAQRLRREAGKNLPEAIARKVQTDQLR